MKEVKMNNIEMRNVEKKDEINKVKENNKQIEQLVQKYIEEYKQKGIPLEENEQAKKLLKYKLGLCLEIYKVEFSGYECVGKQEVHFIKQKGAHPDCYGNENGLTLTTEKDKWLKETAPKMIKGIKEYSPNNKYVGSMDDIYNYVSYLVNEDKTDLDWANDSIPHEAMHIFGVIGGNSFLTEGITEELAREISEKYNLKMAPIGHSIEAEFVRKLESIVGRDAVIESGLMKNKNKDNPDFAEITTKEVTEKFDKIFGNGSLEKYVEELSKIQSELSQDVNLKDEAQVKIKDLMQPIDKYVEEKELNYNNEKYNNENHDYSNILEYQEEMLEYMKEIALEKNITQQIDEETKNTGNGQKNEAQERIEIANKLSTYFNNLNPQIKENSLQWYFAGSLATINMGGAKSITEVILDENNKIIDEGEKKLITKEQKEKMKTFSRNLTQDIDIVNVNGEFWPDYNKEKEKRRKFAIVNIRKENPGVDKLFTTWGQTKIGGTFYVDDVGAEEKIEKHPISKVELEQGTIYMVSPPEQLAHKLHETILCVNDERIEGYEKDIRDIASMFYGFNELYKEKEFVDRVFNGMLEKYNSVLLKDYIEKGLRRIVEDSKKYFLEISGEKEKSKIDDFFAEIMNRRQAIIDKKQNDTLNKQEIKIEQIENAPKKDEMYKQKNITQQIGKATINTSTKQKDEAQENIDNEINKNNEIERNETQK